MKTSQFSAGLIKAIASLSILAGLLAFLPQASARDTDIYSANAKQNCYILMDNSTSMGFGVYQHTIDYGAMFDYLFTLKDSPVGDYVDYIYDTINSSSYFYNNHQVARKIFLWKGRIGVTIATVDGQQVAFTGDAADPNYLWFMSALVDTHTLIDADGNLSHDGSASAQRITVNAGGHVLLDGQILPLGMDIKLHDLVTMYNGAVVDHGFGGLLNAPGYYFSGYEAVTTGSLNPAESGDQDIYFFVTGNWVNMQAMYNLHYTTNNPTPVPADPEAQLGSPAWKYESFPLVSSAWSTLSFSLDYPSGAGNYANSLSETATAQTISHPGAVKMRVHFSLFDVQGNNNASTFNNDYVKVYDSTGAQVAQYDNDNNPTSAGGWTPEITGDTAIIKLKSDNSTTKAGYTIDKISVTYTADASGGTYLMQDRIGVAKDALTYVVEEFRGKMNWGYASFSQQGANVDGAQVSPLLNPTDNDDTQRAAIVTAVSHEEATIAGTPLMEALQDVFEKGYYGRRNVLDDLLCRKNYIISMTDGYATQDESNTRISGVTFGDWDGDGWTSDPYQPPVKPNYYDDVAHWMYTHSWLDKSAVADPANSYVNVITHHVAFGAKQPLLEDAAGESGGEYIVAYNKEQLVAAFHSLALLMSEAVSFTAPVVSVDAVNKIQSGDDLYMGLFLPMDSAYWAGNLKKFKLGDQSAERPQLWMIYDKANHEAIDSTGAFLDNTTAFWGDDTDANDTDNYGAADIKEDGAGEVLLEDVQGYFVGGAYWARPIYTYKGGAMTKFDRNFIVAADLAVADALTRDKLINFTHGYTYDADPATGAPSAVRDWVHGPIIHSRPVVVDYYDTSVTGLTLEKRLIVAGANDGMLHIFDDTTGREVMAFIPGDILPKLQEIQAANSVYDTVDGHIILYRRDKNPKYLIFGERRGGGAYWALDVHDKNPLNWTVAWKYTNPEIAQSWAEVKVASILTGITSGGVRTYKDVAIFTGGYDPDEDNYPEPFNDLDNNGTPYKANGSIDTTEWSQADAAQDVYNNNNYDKYNPGSNSYGRGIYIVDIDDPTNTVHNGVTPILPFSVTYGGSNVTTGSTQARTDMKYCFPAGTSPVVTTDTYTYKLAGNLYNGIRENVLRSLYAPDIYANLYKVLYEFEVVNNGTILSPNWAVSSFGWTVKKIFSANPGSTSASGQAFGGADNADQGRKAFYPPAVSWGGAGSYFDAGNYFFPTAIFSGRDKIASVFFGTGDREHPKYTMVRDRFYAVYDDSTVTAKEYHEDGSFKQDIVVSTVPYTESKLINVTCDDLGGGSTLSVAAKAALSQTLVDDAIYGAETVQLENGTSENDAKGWYIVLADQGSCSGAVSATTSDRDNHDGEHILSQPVLYAGILYFTSYQPSSGDQCNPQGNGFSYALDYTNGSAALNIDTGNGEDKDATDRSMKYVGIYGIPSGFTIVTRKGHVAAMASMGGTVAGGGEPGGGGTPPYEIPSSGKGLDLYYWRDSNSLQP